MVGYVRSEDQVQTDYEDPGHHEPVMSHHKRSHTTPQDAGRAAIFANVKTLALPHYAPADSPLEAWGRAADTFEGTQAIPADLDVVTVQSPISFSSSTSESSLQSFSVNDAPTPRQ